MWSLLKCCYESKGPAFQPHLQMSFIFRVHIPTHTHIHTHSICCQPLCTLFNVPLFNPMYQEGNMRLINTMRLNNQSLWYSYTPSHIWGNYTSHPHIMTQSYSHTITPSHPYIVGTLFILSDCTGGLDQPAEQGITPTHHTHTTHLLTFRTACVFVVYIYVCTCAICLYMCTSVCVGGEGCLVCTCVYVVMCASV